MQPVMCRQKATFMWQIPSLSNEHEILLVMGYTRNNFNKYITSPIIYLMAEYFINDSFTLQDLKESKPKQCFISPIFSLCSFKWYLEIWGNGYDDDEKGSIILFICLASFLSNLGVIRTAFTLTLKELDNISFTDEYVEFTEDEQCFGWHRDILLLKDIDDLQKLTFAVELDILDILDKHRNSVYNEYFSKYDIINPKPIQLPVIRHKCRMHHLQNDHFWTDVYKYNQFKWYLKFHQFQDSTIGLYLAFAPFPKGISSISVKYEFYLKELDVKEGNEDIFDRENFSFGWNIEDAKIVEKIKKTEVLDVAVNFIIYDVYDDNKDVIPHYVENIMNTYTKLPFAKYTWTISESEELKNIKRATIGDGFESELFSIGHLKLYLAVYPNGNIAKREGKCRVFLKLVTFTPMLSKVICNTKVMFHELNIAAFDHLYLDKPDYIWNTLGTFDDIKELETITISLELTMLDVYDKNDNVINNYIDQYEFKQLDNLPMACYEWKITDKNIMNKIKNTRNVFAFVSPPFRAYGEIFFVTLYPNGSRLSRQSTINIFLNWILIGPTFMIQYFIEWVESGKTFTATYSIADTSGSSGSLDWPLHTEDLHKLDTMTIRVKIKLIDAYKNKEVVTDEYRTQNMVKEIEFQSKMYTWMITEDVFQKIKEYRKGISYTSDIFEIYGMNLCLDLFPKGKSLEMDEGSTICINIVSLPCKNSVITLRYSLIVKEVQVKYEGTVIFSKNNKLCTSWGPDRMSFEQLKDLKTCTIELTLELLDALDVNNINDTEDNMLSDNMVISNIKGLDETIHRLNVFNYLEQDEVSENKSIEIMDETIEDELKIWMFNQLKLPEYYQVFIGNNIDNLNMVRMITNNDLDDMNIANIGHRLQILIEIAKLKYQ